MTNDITILSCPQCGFPKIRDCGNGLYQCDVCGTHFDKDENIVLTEQEYIQTCTTEQLAEFLGNIAKNAYQCGQNGKTNKCVNRNHCTGYCDYGWGEWLKQPHTFK